LQDHGIGFLSEQKRYYPLKTVAANFIGFVGEDEKGLEGIEYSLEKHPRKDAVCGKYGNEWIKFSTAQYARNAELLALGLLSTGLKKVIVLRRSAETVLNGALSIWLSL
jgi:hypothetical protein